jgi:hypothetical protein
MALLKLKEGKISHFSVLVAPQDTFGPSKKKSADLTKQRPCIICRATPFATSLLLFIDGIFF